MAMPSMLKSIAKNVLRLVVASFLVVPVIVIAFLLPNERNEAQEVEEALDSEIPLASKIIKRGTIDDQRGSPLFTILPPEIRNRIFAFACKAYETIPYTPNDWYYRPGYHAHRRISTTLLATCRRIYLETYTLPLELNEHVFWGSIERGPPRRYSGIDNYKRTDLNAFFDSLTPHQRASIEEVHLFAQQFWLEDLDLSSDRIATRKIKLTLRHQDWYSWEDNEPLGICPWLPGRVDADDMEREKDTVPSLPRDVDRYVGWGRQFEFVHGLEELEIEFETLRVFKEVEMDPIVTFAKQWQFPLMREGVLEWDEASGVRQSTWTGSKLLRGELDESMFDFHEDNLDSMSDADHESRPDSPDYDTGSTYEFSDWEDEPPSLAEQGYASADMMGHGYSATASQLREAGSDAEHTSDQQDPVTELNNPINQPEVTPDEQEMTGPVLYEPPQIIDVDDNHGIEDEWPTITDAAADIMQDPQSAFPLLALESNVQDYYVVSLSWRKRKRGVHARTIS
jgi:hypothetical protein